MKLKENYKDDLWRANNLPPSETNCDHTWEWSYDCFEDAVRRDIVGSLGIPTKCSECGAEGIEWYSLSNVIDKTRGSNE